MQVKFEFMVPRSIWRLPNYLPEARTWAGDNRGPTVLPNVDLLVLLGDMK